ncbi:hypothetical protein [Nitratifractor sp.]
MRKKIFFMRILSLWLALTAWSGAACHVEIVRGLNPFGDNYLAVRSGPGSGYYMKEALHNGDRVFVCGYNGRWKSIVYGRGCTLSYGSPSGYCRSGWAYGKYLVPAGYGGGYGGGYGSAPASGAVYTPPTPPVVAGRCTQPVRGIYYARLSEMDHYNSRGMRLDSVAAILRQDRANFYKYYRRDPDDTGCGFFASKYNRSIFERIIENSYIPPAVRNAILYDHPYIRVTVHEGYCVEIQLL